jgi:hypothetical protein
MTLTKSDLKSIGSVFDQKFEEKGVATKTDLKGFATKADLDSIKNDTNGIKAVIKTLATKKDLQKIDKKFDKLFDFLDRDYLRVKSDVRDIQSHLNLPVSDF